ncbi:hypothetical protein NKJ12_31535 [Mesorhizobium sp. M0195]
MRWRDVDQDRNIMTIRETKFYKSRLIPMGPHLAQRLYAFMALRSKHLVAVAAGKPLFSFLRGRPVNPGTISIVIPHTGRSTGHSDPARRNPGSRA